MAIVDAVIAADERWRALRHDFEDRYGREKKHWSELSVADCALGSAGLAPFEAWLDKLHPGWQARCGLEPIVNVQSGFVEWLPR